MSKEYDLVVLGGGTGGYVAAIRAAQLGMQVAVVEREKLGGTCLHRGCIPTKTFLRSAEMYRQTKLASEYGVDVTVNKVDLERLQAKKESIIQQLHNGIQTLMKKHKIDVYYGYGRILGPSIFSPLPGTISVEKASGEDNDMLIPKFVLIATGSSPRTIEGIPVDGNTIITSDEALMMTKLPQSIVILGGGVIGIEWASLLSDFGVKVTIIESANHILMTEDDDIRREVEKQLKKRGITIMTNAMLKTDTVQTKEHEVTLEVEHNGETLTLTAEKLLLSIGRKANSEDIGIENTNIELEKGFIKTNEFYQTKESHIYAIGDVIGGLQLAHVASEEGIVAVEHMAGLNPVAIKRENIPANIYAYPEVAKVGLTEREAKETYENIKVGKFPLRGIGKAYVNGDVEGFLKIIVDQDSEDIVGIHIVGDNATELIGEAALAKFLNATAWEISKTIHPHPSLTEVYKEAALATEGLQIHG